MVKKKKSACNVRDMGSIPGLGRSIEEGMATHSSILAWRIPMDRGAWRATVHGVARSQTSLSDQIQHTGWWKHREKIIVTLKLYREVGSLGVRG